MSLDFSVTYSFRPYHGLRVDSAPNENEYREYFLGIKAPVREADITTTFMCRMSWKSGSLNLWNPLGHTGPVTGLLSFYMELHKMHSLEHGP